MNPCVGMHMSRANPIDPVKPIQSNLKIGLVGLLGEYGF
jgi:hypothetical protein